MPPAPDMAAMRAAAETTTALLRALANTERLLLLCQLAHGEKSVGELEALLDIRQPTLSQQLGCCGRKGSSPRGAKASGSITSSPIRRFGP